MAQYRYISRLPFILRTSSITVGNSSQRCIKSLANKCTPCVVYVSPLTSGYHTSSRKARDSLLKTHKFSVFSTRSVQRNNSYFASLYQKAFVVRAEEPLPDSAEPSFASHTESVVESSGVSNATFDNISNVSPPPDPLDGAQEAITYIPAPPAPSEAAEVALNALGEPTIQSLGLGGWSPVGMMQNFLDFLHVSCDLPWWGTIALTTICIRIAIFPLVIKSQKNAAHMSNNMPQLQALQMKISEARNCGDNMKAATLSMELMKFMKEKEISPMKNMIAPLVQAPVFLSMFWALRGMANLPLESMKIGGLFWFTDLTIADPYFLLPLITSTTLLATIEVGADGLVFPNSNMKWILRGLPLIVFPVTAYFPSAVLCYWVSANFLSLIQVAVLKVPRVREYLDMPERVIHNPDTLPPKKGMVAGFKESWSNMKATQELQRRVEYDEMRFRKAGMGPITRTFKHDPTKKVINVKPKVKSHK